jgi:hypothetical protein
MVTDASGQTPLGLICERHASRLRTALQAVDQGEESQQIYEQVLRPFWNQLCILLNASAGYRFFTPEHDSWRLVHILTTVPNCPTILFDLALKLHPEQIKEKIYGSLPLHYAAECPTSRIDGQHQDGYYVCTLLSLFPRASQIPDAAGRLPLHLAIQSGKTYHAVLRKLFDAFPRAISTRDGKHYLLPFMLAAVPQDRRNQTPPQSSSQQVDSMLELLRLDPSGLRLVSQPFERAE